VGLQGLSEFTNFFTEHLSSWRFLEVFGSKLDLVEGSVGEESLVGKIVLLGPVGLSEVLVMVRNIIELIGKLVHGSVVEVDTVFGLVDVVLEDSANILPLFDELLTSWGSNESLIKCMNFLSGLAVSPFLESTSERSGGWGIMDLLSNYFDVLSFLSDSLLTEWGNLDVEGVHGIISISRDGTGGGDGSEGFHLFL
jgi:hypothetical protein